MQAYVHACLGVIAIMHVWSPCLQLQNTKPCVLCPTRIDDADTYLSHAHLHMEVDTTTMCCVCKHKITSQVSYGNKENKL